MLNHQSLSSTHYQQGTLTAVVSSGWKYLCVCFVSLPIITWELSCVYFSNDSTQKPCLFVHFIPSEESKLVDFHSRPYNEWYEALFIIYIYIYNPGQIYVGYGYLMGTSLTYLPFYSLNWIVARKKSVDLVHCVNIMTMAPPLER